MRKPLITVIIPAYNCDRYINATIESVLNQTLDDFVVLVIDDCSTDNTVNIVNNIISYDTRVNLLKNECNMGVAKTRNRGFSEVNSEYVALLDGDDLWLPSKLEKQIELMKDTSIDFCFTAFSFVDEQSQPIYKPYIIPEKVSFKSILRDNTVNTSTFLCRSELIKKHKMHSEFHHEDYVFFCELLQNNYTGRGLPEPLAIYRKISTSRNHNKYKSALYRWQVYRSYLGLSLPQSFMAFIWYVYNGVKKYHI